MSINWFLNLVVPQTHSVLACAVEILAVHILLVGLYTHEQLDVILGRLLAAALPTTPACIRAKVD